MLPAPAKAALRWLRRVLVAVDQLGNVVFLNGEPEETISFHAATARAAGRRWGCVLCRLLDLAQARHCDRALAANATRATALAPSTVPAAV